MIKDIFFPDRLGSYYILSERILGIEIGKGTVYGTLVLAHGNKRTVLDWFEEPLAVNEMPYEERASHALQVLIARVKNYDIIVSAFPSGRAVFKELSFPFASRENIRMVLPMELSTVLPFPSNQAIFDFIIIGTHIPDNITDVLVAAVQKEYVDAHLALYKHAQVQPQKIVIDLFALHGLYSQIPAYSTKTSALIDIGASDSRILYCSHGKPSHIRIITQGIVTLARVLSEQKKISPQEAYDELMRFGIFQENRLVYESLSDVLNTFWDRIQFTLTSFAAQERNAVQLEIIFVLGSGAQLGGLTEFFAQKSSIPVEIFNPDLIVSNALIIKEPDAVIPYQQAISLSAALPSETIQDFNLAREIASAQDDKKIVIQVSVMLSLLLVFMVSLITYGIMHVRTLSSELRRSKEEAEMLLQEQFPHLEEDPDIDNMIVEAERLLHTQKERWFKFSSLARSEFLRCLLDLTSRVSQEKTGFFLERLVMTNASIILYGRVRDFDALKIFEHAIEAQPTIFAFKQKLEEPDFTKKGLEITLLNKPKGT